MGQEKWCFLDGSVITESLYIDVKQNYKNKGKLDNSTFLEAIICLYQARKSSSYKLPTNFSKSIMILDLQAGAGTMGSLNINHFHVFQAALYDSNVITPGKNNIFLKTSRHNRTNHVPRTRDQIVRNEKVAQV